MLGKQLKNQNIQARWKNLEKIVSDGKKRKEKKLLHSLHLRNHQYGKLVLEGLHHSKHHESHWKRLQQKYNHSKELTNIMVPPLESLHCDPACRAFLYTYKRYLWPPVGIFATPHLIHQQLMAFLQMILKQQLMNNRETLKLDPQSA